MHSPPISLSFRLFVAVYGIGLLIWFGIEDQNTWSVTLFGVLLAVLVVVGWLLRQNNDGFTHPTFKLLWLVLSGGIIGAGSSLATVLLMFFKNAWHAHLFPDYPTSLMFATLERLPIWTVAGALIGLAAGLVWRVRHSSPSH